MREIKNQRFKPGQEVVCVDADWVPVRPGIRRTIDPVYNQIVEIDYYCGHYCQNKGASYGQPFVHIKGFEACYTQDAFEPLVSDSILERELEEVIKMEEAPMMGMSY